MPQIHLGEGRMTINKPVIYAILFFAFMLLVLYGDRFSFLEPQRLPACLPNCQGQDLTGASLSAADLRGANLQNTTLFGADSTRADLRGANLLGADLGKANLRGAKIDDSTQIDDKWRLVWQILHRGGAGLDLPGVDLSQAALSRTDLTGANLSGADLHDIDLRGSGLKGANLQNANLTGADLYRAVLSNANLSGADLTDAVVRGAEMDGVAMPKDWDKMVKPFY